MQTVGAQEAARRLEELLDRVQQGEHVVVTREGRHVATIIPVSVQATHSSMDRVLARRERIRREGRGISLAEILNDRDAGRR